MAKADKDIAQLWQLGSTDKLIHRQMAHASTAIKRVAFLLREYKGADAGWVQSAEEAEVAARVLQNWMWALRKQEHKRRCKNGQ